MAGEDTPQPSARKAGPVVFDCPGCGATVTIRAAGQTLVVACSACLAIIDATDERHEILQAIRTQRKEDPIVPLGTRGKLRGVTWEVIGFMERCDQTNTYFWREYLLFNPIRGFRWLTEFDGHWNYVVMVKNKPEGFGKHLTYLGKRFQLFHEGAAKVTYVLGEFYWQVKVNETVKVKDYINPPEMLSYESSQDEVVWSLSEYLSPDEVKKAFNVKDSMPFPLGVAPNQPSGWSPTSKPLLRFWKWLLVAAVVLQFANLMFSRNHLAFKQIFIHDPQTPQRVETPPFELKGVGNAVFRLIAPIKNDWFEISAELIDEDSGESIDFEHGVEYYFGYDSDGSWSEGSQSGKKYIPAIPAGRYHLKFLPSGGKQSSQPMEYEIAVMRGVPTWTNFILVLLFLSVFPGLVWWRARNFELSRWSTSDHSPYWNLSEE